jgi:hypothetical protein
MDYKKEENKEELKKFKREHINKLSTQIDNLIEENQKKAALISYWIKSFSNFLQKETTFDPKYLPVYKQGTLIEVDLGFNVGSEQGGLHYAIVLNSNDKKNNPTLTIVPLSSIKEKTKLKEYDVFLGEEIHELIFERLKELDDEINEKIETLKKKPDNTYDEQVSEYFKMLKVIDVGFKKVKKLKFGSYAIINQITTISKMRIKNPLDEVGHLSNLVVSDKYMEEIQKNIKKYIKM